MTTKQTASDEVKAPELLPCPFCGGNFIITTRVVRGRARETFKWIAMCNEDDGDCNMEISTYPCDTIEEAIKQWNTRADLAHAVSPSVAQTVRDWAAELADPIPYDADSTGPIPKPITLPDCDLQALIDRLHATRDTAAVSPSVALVTVRRLWDKARANAARGDFEQGRAAMGAEIVLALESALDHDDDD